MFSQDRSTMRQYFFTLWQKFQSGKPLEPLEQIIAAIIQQHPEYHSVLAKPDQALDRDYTPESGQSNPFLHMGMHIAIQEQRSTNRPAGISDIYQQLISQSGNPHASEHQMMECLGEMMWQAQRSGQQPDEQAYLEQLKQLAQKK